MILWKCHCLAQKCPVVGVNSFCYYHTGFGLSSLSHFPGCSAAVCSTARKLTVDGKSYLSVASLTLVGLKLPTQSTASFLSNALCCQGRNAEGLRDFHWMKYACRTCTVLKAE